MDRNASPKPAPAAERGPVVTLDAEALTLPPLYRSEGFAEDLLDGDAVAPAERPRAVAAAAWLYVLPLTAATLGVLASALALPA